MEPWRKSVHAVAIVQFSAFGAGTPCVGLGVLAPAEAMD